MRCLTPLLLAPALLALVSGCAGNIPNTEVPDTPQNRGVIAFMEDYRRAVEEADIAKLVAMASEDYLDDNGTPGGGDDIDYETLQARLGEWQGRVDDVRYEIKYLRVTFQDHPRKVLVEFRFSGRFRVVDPDGETTWARRVGDQRMELEYDTENEVYRILSGM